MLNERNAEFGEWRGCFRIGLWCAFFTFLATVSLQAEPLLLVNALEHGQQVYQQNCSGCHGAEGHGDGPAAPYLYPKPRDFSKGLFKLTSTPTGNLPTDDDLFRVITNGMPGSAMPSWEMLRLSDRWAAVAYVKSLVKAWDEDGEQWIDLYRVRGQAESIPVPAQPALSAENLARGKLLFRKAECWQCHGDLGRGDGPSSPTLKDSWNQPIRPRDFTAGIFKGGHQPVDLFRRISIGMAGTPMPSHEKISETDRWYLAQYVQSLIRPGAQELAVQKRKTIPVRATAGNLPESPDDPAWDRIDPVYLALMPLWWRDHRIDGVLVRAVHNSKEMAIHVAWEDINENSSAVRVEQFSDGVAIQFALSEDVPFIAMGGLAGKVNIWFWRAERQTRPDVENEYPNLVADGYEYTSLGNNGEGKKTEIRTAVLPAAQQATLFMPAWTAGNWVADPLRKTAVDDLNAHGFGTLGLQKAVDQNVEAKATWKNGVWSCVFRRAMTNDQALDAQFTPGIRRPVGFAVWDGSERDRNGQKSITVWHDLEVQW